VGAAHCLDGAFLGGFGGDLNRKVQGYSPEGTSSCKRGYNVKGWGECKEGCVDFDVLGSTIEGKGAGGVWYFPAIRYAKRYRV